VISLFCRFCGKTVFDDSIFCSYCGKKLVENCENDNSSFDFSSLDGALNVDKAYQANLKKARAFAITNKYQQAMEIYTKMIDDDPTDINGYIGCIRVASKNYTDINGYFYFKCSNGSSACYYTSTSVDVFKKILNGAPIIDKECADFIKKYEEHIIEQEKHRLEQEKARIEQEKKRQEELERQRREKEEIEKRKPQEFKEAIQIGNMAVTQKNFDTAYKAYVIALRLAKEIQAELPNNFLDNLFVSCEGREREASKNNDIIGYLTPIANNNNSNAQCLMARISLAKDSPYDADRWYEMAAKNGAAEAFYYLGNKYHNCAEKISYNERDYLERRKEIYLQAYYWYKKAFDKNYPKAIEKIALYSRCGYGIEKNTNYALEQYKRINSNYNVAQIYQFDLKNPLEAINWYKKDNRNLEIASIYENLGRKNEAIEYYEKCVVGVNYPSERAQKALARLLYGSN
jgi:TPR repeat protein